MSPRMSKLAIDWLIIIDKNNFKFNDNIGNMIKMSFSSYLCYPFAINWINKMHGKIESKTA